MEIINYKKYGKCLKISNGSNNLYVTLEVGPRIIFFGEDENIFYEDLEDHINKDVSTFHSTFKKDDKWHIYGGHRLWKAPEDNLTYYPDNNTIKYEIEGNKVIIKAPIETSTLLEKHIIIESLDNGDFSVTNRVINRGEEAVKIAAWGLSVCKPSGQVVVDYTNIEGEYLPNRSISLWPYSNILDKRIVINNDSVIINIEKEEEASKEPFKIGFYIKNGIVSYKMDNGKVFSKSIKANKNFDYPDYGSNLEIYTINWMVEIETLSNFKNLKKDEYVEINEIWSLR